MKHKMGIVFLILKDKVDVLYTYTHTHTHTYTKNAVILMWSGQNHWKYLKHSHLKIDMSAWNHEKNANIVILISPRKVIATYTSDLIRPLW